MPPGDGWYEGANSRSSSAISSYAFIGPMSVSASRTSGSSPGANRTGSRRTITLRTIYDTRRRCQEKTFVSCCYLMCRWVRYEHMFVSLSAQICDIESRQRALDAERAEAVAAWAESGEWGDDGSASAAARLARDTSVSGQQARERVRIARLLTTS